MIYPIRALSTSLSDHVLGFSLRHSLAKMFAVMKINGYI